MITVQFVCEQCKKFNTDYFLQFGHNSIIHRRKTHYDSLTDAIAHIQSLGFTHNVEIEVTDSEATNGDEE